MAKIYGITTKEVTQIIKEKCSEDKEKVKEILKTEGDDKCLSEETSVSS